MQIESINRHAAASSIAKAPVGCKSAVCCFREVFDILPRVSAQESSGDTETNADSCGPGRPQSTVSAGAAPPCSCFSLRSRGDAWALLDWKAVAAEPDGSLHVLDFCEISTKTEHDMLYIHPDTGESVLPSHRDSHTRSSHRNPWEAGELRRESDTIHSQRAIETE